MLGHTADDSVLRLNSMQPGQHLNLPAARSDSLASERPEQMMTRLAPPPAAAVEASSPGPLLGKGSIKRGQLD